MLVLIVTSIIALIITFYASRDEIPYGLEIAFLLITFVAAIHYNYGSDYKVYAAIFDEITNNETTINHIDDAASDGSNGAKRPVQALRLATGTHCSTGGRLQA